MEENWGVLLGLAIGGVVIAKWKSVKGIITPVGDAVSGGVGAALGYVAEMKERIEDYRAERAFEPVTVAGTEGK